MQLQRKILQTSHGSHLSLFFFFFGVFSPHTKELFPNEQFSFAQLYTTDTVCFQWSKGSFLVDDLFMFWLF